MKKKLLKLYVRSGLDRFIRLVSNNDPIVFMLHRFNDPSIGYIDPCAVFGKYLEKCIVYLLSNRFKIRSVESVINDFHEKKFLKRNIAFTVDDGYIDFKNVAFPIFKKYNVPVTVFLTTKFIDGKLMQWWDQLSYILSKTRKFELELEWKEKIIHCKIDSEESRKGYYQYFVSQLKDISQKDRNDQVEALANYFGVELPPSPPLEYSALSWDDVRALNEEGIDFGAHTATHPILGYESKEKQKEEIQLSLKTLEKRIGKKTSIFCYPNGKINDFTSETISILKKENVMAAVTAEPGFIRVPDSGLNDNYYYKLPRFSFPVEFHYFVQCVSGLEMVKNVLLGRE